MNGMGRNAGLIFGGMLMMVFGLALAVPLLAFAVTSGSDATIGSFSGAKSFNDLMPLIFYFGLIAVSLGAMGLGMAGAAGKGPTAN